MALLHFLQDIRLNCPDWLNLVFMLISESILIAAPLIAAAVYWCVDKKKGTYILCTFLFAQMLSEILKVTVCIYRPWILDPTLIPATEVLGTATSYSFPSSHSCAAASIFTSLMLAFPDNKTLRAVCPAFILLIMFARMYLGCHTPVDVCCGALIGLSMAFLLRPMLSESFNEKRFTALLLPVSLLLSAGLILYIINKEYPVDFAADGSLLVDPIRTRLDALGSCGMLCGSFLGLFIERTRIGFSMPETQKEALRRLIPGLLLFGLLFLVLRSVLGNFASREAERFLIFFLCTLVAVGIYPFGFSKHK